MLEFEITLVIIHTKLRKGIKLLDLGGGPGRYSIELAKLGYDEHTEINKC